ncbi:MAG TPA: cytochrome b [Methylophaga sp.]|nr:cytochrome b [Methylophaga sp.]HEC60120.1 cytochrome b [Methylophaga sp.]
MLKNSKTSYGWVSIVIHWLMAVGIIFMFGLGLYMVELTYYDAWYKGSLDLHKSLGVLLIGFLIFRLFWRAATIQPTALAAPKWQQIAAHGMHHLLYLGMILVLISGYLISTADGHAIVVFEGVNLPALPWHIANQEDIAGEIHNFLAWTLIILSTFHALAALKHHFINKDRTLIRMLKTDNSN